VVQAKDVAPSSEGTHPSEEWAPVPVASTSSATPAPASGTVPRPLAGWSVVARTAELDEIQDALARSIGPHRVDKLGRGPAIDAQNEFAEFGGLRLVRLGYHAEVVIRPNESELDSVLIEMPLSGHSDVTRGRESVISTPQLATILMPDIKTRLTFSSDCEKYVLRLDRDRLDRHCAALLGRDELRRPLVFDLGFDLTAPGGRDWMTLIRGMEEAAGQATSLWRAPLIAAQFEQLFMTTLLLAQPHNFSDAFRQPEPAIAPFYVKRAEAYIEAHLEEPVSIVDLAAAAGVSARSLQTGFQQFRGTTPMAHMRSLRLKRAHDELLAADPQRASVTDVAMRWGFVHLGKFAVAYKERFGESPRETLSRWR
jgi:AraC-like DNA-binding protein